MIRQVRGYSANWTFSLGQCRVWCQFLVNTELAHR